MLFCVPCIRTDAQMMLQHMFPQVLAMICIVYHPTRTREFRSARPLNCPVFWNYFLHQYSTVSATGINLRVDYESFDRVLVYSDACGPLLIRTPTKTSLK